MSGSNKENSIVDLFCGCGGLSLGAHLAGFETVLAIDVDSILSSSFSLNFPMVEPRILDLKTLKSSRIKRLAGDGRITGVIGGPPCQGFSSIGKKARDDDRNKLVGQFFRHVAALNPKFFLMENVPGLLDRESIATLDKGLARLPSIYTVLPPIVLDASNFGAPTLRKRAFIVGYDPTCVDRIRIDDFEDAQSDRPVSVKEAIFDLPEPRAAEMSQAGFDWWSLASADGINLSEYALQMRSEPAQTLGWQVSREMLAQGKVTGLAKTEHSVHVKRRFAETVPGMREKVSRYPRLAWEGQCKTLRAGTGSERGSYQAVRPIHPEQPRVITVREAARLQGFPDWFVFHSAVWHSFRMIGNSVAPPIARSLLQVIGVRCGVFSTSDIDKAA